MCFLESAFAFSMAFLTRRLMMLFSSDRTLTLCGLLLRPAHDSAGKIIDTRIQCCLRGGGGGCMDGHVCACAILKV